MSLMVLLHLCNSLVLIFWCIFVVCVTYDEIKQAAQRGRIVNVLSANTSSRGQEMFLNKYVAISLLRAPVFFFSPNGKGSHHPCDLKCNNLSSSPSSNFQALVNQMGTFAIIGNTSSNATTYCLLPPIEL